MNPEENRQRFNSLATNLHRIFVANHWAYAEQGDDGKYRTVYKPLDVARVENMLVRGESHLTYQLSSGNVRWICFDIDIKSSILVDAGYVNVKTAAEAEVVRVSTSISDFLTKNNIPHLIEFSGSRGVHIWLVWQDYVQQAYGYAAQQSILDQTRALEGCKYIELDRFPQTTECKGLLGKGVKLPLSKHKKSGFYSCIVQDMESLTAIIGAPHGKLDNRFRTDQDRLLSAFKLSNWEDIGSALKVAQVMAQIESGGPSFTKRTILMNSDAPNVLGHILDGLSACSVMRPIIERYRENVLLSEKERAIVVGLIGRIRFDGDREFGKRILLEFFSKQPNYNESLTKGKLDNLNLYPPTCEYLRRTMSAGESSCEAHGRCSVQKSPVELIEGCQLEPENLFALSHDDFDKLRVTSIHYAKINDEIDLHFLSRGMKALDTESSILKSKPRSLMRKSWENTTSSKGRNRSRVCGDWFH